MATKEEIERIKGIAESERTEEEKATLAAAERQTDENAFPTSWDEVFQHPRFKQLNQRAQAAEADLAKAKAEREAEQQRLLAEQGRFKELYEKSQAELEKLRAQSSKLGEYESTLKDTLEAQLKEFPEELRKLVPEELSVEQQLKWVARNRQTLMKSKAPEDIGARRRSSSGGGEKPLTDEERQIAKKFGYTEEEYLKFRDEPQPQPQAQP